MATKSKKRNPALVFIIFVFSLSTFLAVLLVALPLMLMRLSGIGALGFDYKQSKAYRDQIFGGYLIEGMDSAIYPAEMSDQAILEEYYTTIISENEGEISFIGPSNDAANTERNTQPFSQEGSNLSWMICDINGNVALGNTDTETPEQFMQQYREELDNSYRSYNFFASIPSFTGYDHLIVMQNGVVREWMNTRMGQIERETPLVKSPYVSWISPEMREKLVGLTEEAGATVCLAVKAEGALVNNSGSIYRSYFNWFMTARIMLVLVGVLFVSALALLGVAIKRKSLLLANEKIACFSAWIPLEFKLAALVAAIGLLAAGIDSMGWSEVQTVLLCLLSFWIYWGMINELNYKRKKEITHNIAMLLLRAVKSLESKYAFCARMKRRLVLVIGVEILIVALIGLFLLGFGGAGILLSIPLVGLGLFMALHYVFRYNRQIDELTSIIDYAGEVRAGSAELPLILPKDSDFTEMAETLNDIHSGMARMVDARIKSDQMKAELITNVSHDLKTPLTSIINYVDLLSREQLSPDFANDYVKVLAGKSERLKNLVQDLFEISKAQSGAIDFVPEKLNIVSLLEQTVAEMGARSDSMGEIRLQFSQPHLLVCADGKKLHRVFENLLGNALKYSMPGTRIYVSMESSGQYVQTIFKNVAGYEMSFSEQEIVERFQRGDSSRTSDGSGLGLAIAKSFLELNGGSLRIELDGDLFKAIASLPVYQPDEDSGAAPQPRQQSEPILSSPAYHKPEQIAEDPSPAETVLEAAPVLQGRSLAEAVHAEHGQSPLETAQEQLLFVPETAKEHAIEEDIQKVDEQTEESALGEDTSCAAGQTEAPALGEDTSCAAGQTQAPASGEDTSCADGQTEAPALGEDIQPTDMQAQGLLAQNAPRCDDRQENGSPLPAEERPHATVAPDLSGQPATS